MAVAFGAATEIAAGATANPTAGNHTPSGTPRGVEVFITHAGSTDIITGVTYGGQPLTRLRAEFDTTGEDSAAYQYFLGTAIPTGTQSVSVARSEAITPIHVVCRSLTAGDDIEVVDTDGMHGAPDVASPSITLQTTGRTCIAVGGMWNGHGLISDCTDLGTMTRDADHDFGANTSFASHQSTPGSSDFTFGYTAATQSSYALIASLFAEAEAHTRFYFFLDETTDNVTLAPPVDAAWDRTADTSFERQPALIDPTGFDCAGTNSNLFNSTSTSSQVYHQSISDPLASSGTISGSFSIAIQASQSGASGAGNGHMAISLRVVRPDGVERGVLLQIMDSSGTEFAASPTSRIFSNIALSPVAAIAGDRLVLEIGVHADTPPADTTYSFSVNQGSGIPELTLVEGTTGSNQPWWELSQALTFAAPDSVFGSADITATLSPTSSGTAVQQFTASGTPVATLSATASGTATSVEGPHASGSPVATLSPFSSGTAVQKFTGSGAATVRVRASSTGIAFSNGITVHRAKGGAMRFIQLTDPVEPPKKKRKKKPKPPVPDAAELPEARIDLNYFSPIQISRDALRVGARLREPIPVKERPKDTRSVEDKLLQNFIQSMLGPDGLASLDDDESLPYEVRRFLRQGR